jgi:hypothetical protein
MPSSNRHLLTRRSFTGLALAGIVLPPIPHAMANRFVADTKMKPGDFTWSPERAADGAVVVIVSIPEQLVHVYRGGVEIGVSTCSTGKPGHSTPTGVFTILEKQRQHVSSIYKGAEMPNMERLTWTGIALHAGKLPGYPASHGCVRLPLKFSELLFGVTHVGAAVIIADERTQPVDVVHPGGFLSADARVEAESVTDLVGKRVAHSPWEATIRYPVVSVLVSRADGRAYLTRDGVLDGTMRVDFDGAGKPLGTHVYSLVGPAADGSGLKWLAFGLGKKKTEQHVVSFAADATLKRIRFAERERAIAIARTLHPGATLMITDMSAPQATRSTPRDFAVIASDRS